jgi:predicted acyltransferase (DUF342 family)/photosystem II stability/assembly factor-like uncharacterized protein
MRDDVSLNQRLFVGGDVSMNIRLFVGGDVSLNQRLYVSGDVSMNSRLSVLSDVSFNKNFEVLGKTIIRDDVSLNQRLFVGGDTSLNLRLFVGGDVSLNQRLYVSGDVSMNSRLSVLSDVSLNKNFEVLGKTIMRDDVSLNQRLFVGGDTSLNLRLFVGGDVSLNQRLYVSGDVSMNSRLSVLSDVSFNRNLDVSGSTIQYGDVSMNSRLSVLSDVSFNKNFQVSGTSILNKDVSMNSRLFVGNDLTIYGRLNVQNYTNNNIINTTTTNYSLIIAEDLSLNNRLFVGQDVSMSIRLFVGGDVSLNQRLYVSGDVSMNSRLSVLSDVSLNKNFEVLGKTIMRDDVSLNQRLFVASDVSLNKKLGVLGTTLLNSDVFMNSRLYVIDNVFLSNKLYVNDDVSFNNRLNINGDVSMNSRLFISNDVSLNSRIYVKGDAFMNNRLFTDNINLSLSNNIFTLNALTGNPRFSNNPTLGYSGGGGFDTNVPNFNIFFSPFNSNINIENNLDLYIDNPRNNLILGQYIPGSALYNLYTSENTTITSTYNNFTNNLAISSYALSNITNTYDSTNNVAIGSNSLNYLSAGHCNTAIGSGSMVNLGINTWSSVGSTFNSITIPRSFGQNYLPSANTDNNTSNFNTAIGYFSMSSSNIYSSSNKNTVLGALAFSDTFDSLSTSPVSQRVYTQNTFIGYNAQPMTGIYTNQLVLGTSTETTYIPGKFSVISDTSLNGRVNIFGDVSLNGRLFLKSDALSNNSIPTSAISGLSTVITSLVRGEIASASTGSSANSSVMTSIVPLDSEYNFLTNFSQKNNTDYNWMDIAMSFTGEYQVAIEIYGNIYYSNNFGETWNKANVSNSYPALGTTSLNWTAVAMSYTGQYQIASAVLPNGVDSTPTDPTSCIFSSSNYGISWSLTFKNTLSYTAYINALAISSDGLYQYASVYNSNFLYSDTYGSSWAAPNAINVSNNASVGNGNWQAIATSSNGQYICIGGYQTYIYVSNNYGATVKTANQSSNLPINSISMSYSGQYMIVSTGSFNTTTAISKYSPGGSSSKTNGLLYFSSNYGNSFYAVTNATFASWIVVRISGNGQYIVAVTQSDSTGSPGNPGSIWYSYNFGLTWNKNNTYSNYWTGISISATGQYLSLISPNKNIYTSITPFYNESFSGTLSTNNMNISGLLNITGTSAPIQLNDDSILTTAELSLDYYNGFGKFWDVNSPAGSYNNLSISLTGQYQTAVSNTNIYVSNNYGINWIATSYGSLSSYGWHSVYISGNGKYQYAVPNYSETYAQSGYIYFSDNFGSNWIPCYNTISTNKWSSISCSSSGQYVIVSSKNNSLYLSTSYGNINNWNYIGNNDISLTSNKYWQSVCISSSGQYIYAAAISSNSDSLNGENIYYSNDFGSNWNQTIVTSTNTNGGKYWQQICCSANGEYVYACASSNFNSNSQIINDTVYKSTNYGVKFTQTTLTRQAWQYVSCSSSGKYLLAVSLTYNNVGTTIYSNGSVYKSIDYGQNWSSITLSDVFNGCAISSNCQYLAICSSSSIYTSTIPYPYFSISDHLLVGGDVSMNSRLSIGSDVSIYGRLSVNSYSANTIMTTSTTNYTMIIAEDLSINGVINVKQAQYRDATMSLLNTSNKSAIKIRGDADINDSLCIGLWGDTGGNNSTGYIQTIIDSPGAPQGYPLLLNPNSGNVGIGNTSPTYKLDVNGTLGVTGATTLSSTLGVTGATTLSSTLGVTGALTASSTITATGQITGASFNATSDQRIKTNIDNISGKFALDTIRNINPVSYNFIDDSKQKSSIGFIAQEIQKSLENSVSKQTKFIPNIYENIDIDNKTITLNDKFTTDISLCDYPVKLQFNDLANNTLYGTIDKIIDSKTFTLIDRLDTSLNSVFLYGQEVDDFLSINYDSIFTVVTSAVKQLDIELQETKQIVKDQANTINKMRSELSELKTQMSNIIRYLNNK